MLRIWLIRDVTMDLYPPVNADNDFLAGPCGIPARRGDRQVALDGERPSSVYVLGGPPSAPTISMPYAPVESFLDSMMIIIA